MKKEILLKDYWLYFLFLLTIILTILPFFKVGFTTADDLEYYISVLRNSVFEDAEMYAKHAGRFYFFITKPLYHFPYIIDNFYFTKIIQYVFLILSFVLFALIVKKLFKLKEFALLIFLLLFTFLTVTPRYFIAITAYPFYFTFSFSVFLFSFLRLLKYFETHKYKYLVQSAVLAGFTFLFYEVYLVFIMFILGYILFKNISKYGKKAFRMKLFYKELLPYFIVIIIYLLVYFIFRIAVETEKDFYSGSSFVEEFSFLNFFRILWYFNKSVIPTFAYHDSLDVIAINSIFETGHKNNFWYILTHLEIATFINVILQCTIFIYLFAKMKSDISWKKILWGIIISIIFAFSAHLLLAISQKYNASTWYQYNGYVTSYYSYFGITLAIGLLMYAGFKLFYKYKWLKIGMISIFTLVILYIAVIIGYTNDHLSRDWERSQNRFRVIDEMIEKGAFDIFNENDVIYLEELNNSSSVYGPLITRQTFTWEQYIYLKSGKKLRAYQKYNKFITDINEQIPDEIYYLSKYETPKNNDMLIVISKVNINSLDFENEENIFQNSTTNESYVYYYSINKEFTFEYYILEDSQNNSILIDNKENININRGWNHLKVSNSNKNEIITSFSLKSEVPFLINDFYISNIGDSHVNIYYTN